MLSCYPAAGMIVSSLAVLLRSSPRNTLIPLGSVEKAAVPSSNVLDSSSDVACSRPCPLHWNADDIVMGSQPLAITPWTESHGITTQ